MADVDVLPSLEFSMDLLRPKKREQLQEQLQGGFALVLPLLDVAPASEEEGLAVAKRLVSGEPRSLLIDPPFDALNIR